MEIPIQVAVQICPCYPNEPCCVETIPNYADRIGNQLNGVRSNEYLDGIDSINTGLVQVAKTYLREDKNGNPECSEKTSFPIQHALPYGCSQEYLYQKTVLPMISNFLEGFDISIVTYGQYGTGKTYSMYGPGFDCVYKEFKESEQGIVVRAISDIFAHLMRRPTGGRFSMTVAWIDVRGEEINDILGEGIVQCHSIDDVFQCLRIGLANRNSEQSHNLFTITIEQQWITPNGLIQHRLSTASFCDLSGTGRIPPGNEFHEEISVPRDIGLQSLERIVSTLCTPTIGMLDNEKINLMNQYEGTMLTKLLKDSFGGRAQTLMIFCVSSLEHDTIETIQNLQFAYKTQFVRNKVVMNTFSDNNMPLANFIDPNEQDMAKMMNFNPTTDKSIRKNLQNSLGLKFANSQWLKLISNAEGLFNKLLVNNKTLNEQDRECIEEWIFLKQECDECLSSAGLPSIPHHLGPIQETNEPGENSSDDGDGNGNTIGQDKMHGSLQPDMESDRFTILNETDNESDSDQIEYLKERISDLWMTFSCKMNEVIDTNYNEFTKKYPKPVMNSCDDQQNDLACVKVERSNSVVEVDEPIIAYRNSCRRRSIQTGDSGTGDITNAEIAHLKRIADETIQSSQSSTNTVCREANMFLENSDEMHPLRMNKANEALTNLIHQIKILQNDIYAKGNRIADLRHNIRQIQQVIDENGSRVKAKRELNRRETKLLEKRRKLMTNSREKKNMELLAKNEMELNEVGELKKASRDSDNKSRELQQQIQERQKILTILAKELKKDKKLLEMLESKLKHEMSKYAKEDKKSMALSYVDAQMTQLDCVIKERKYLQQTHKDSETEESVRHEIRNLRNEHQRLTDVQCVLHQKQKCNKITEREARQLLECDVVKEVIDHAIELKNQIICGRDVTNRKTFFSDNPDLINQLNKLPEKEMRILLYKCFQKIVDLRESSRQLEEQLIHSEKKCNECELRERFNLQKFEQLLLREQSSKLRLQKQYETALTKLFEKACENCVSLSSMSSDPTMLRLPSHLIQSTHRHQHTVSNEIGFNIHGYDRASQQQRRSHRNVSSPLPAPLDQEAHEPKQKSSLFSFLKHSSSGGLKRNLQYPQLMLTNHSEANPNPENKVVLNKTKKKIMFNIQQHRT